MVAYPEREFMPSKVHFTLAQNVNIKKINTESSIFVTVQVQTITIDFH